MKALHPQPTQVKSGTAVVLLIQISGGLMKISDCAKIIADIIKEYGRNILYKNHTGEINIKLHCVNGFVKEYEIGAPKKVKLK